MFGILNHPLFYFYRIAITEQQILLFERKRQFRLQMVSVVISNHYFNTSKSKSEIYLIS